MVTRLEATDLRHLSRLLSSIPQLNTEQQRRQLLTLAGLANLIPYVDISGTPFVATTEIITYLAQYGRISYEQEALGIFLNTLIEMEFVRGDERLFVNKLLDKYKMMDSIAISDSVIDTSTKLDISAEKIIGENTLRPIAFLAEGLRVSKAVAYILVQLPNQPPYVGTGFLISSRLLITNHHVLPDTNAAESALFRFNFEETFDGKAVAVTDYKYQHGGVFQSSKEYDYTILEIDSDAGNIWGYLPLRNDAPTPAKGARVNIIQHPSGRPKHISLQNNFLEYSDKDYLQYITATQPGSSGSPVFNDSWQVVALHHAGGYIIEPATNRTYFRNQGIRISAILPTLSETVLNLMNG